MPDRRKEKIISPESGSFSQPPVQPFGGFQSDVSRQAVGDNHLKSPAENVATLGNPPKKTEFRSTEIPGRLLQIAGPLAALRAHIENGQIRTGDIHEASGHNAPDEGILQDHLPGLGQIGSQIQKH